MKFTEYFKYTRKRPDRSKIEDKWIEKAIKAPEAESIQTDGRIRRWIWIEEEGKYLRVVLLMQKPPPLVVVTVRLCLKGFLRWWLLQHRKPLWGAARKPPALQVVVDYRTGIQYTMLFSTDVLKGEPTMQIKYFPETDTALSLFKM